MTGSLISTNWQPGDEARMLVEEILADESQILIGTLILVKGDAAWIAPHPALRSGEGQTRRKPYWKNAHCMSYSELIERSRSRQLPRLVLTAEALPELWQIDEAYFADTSALPLKCSFTSEQLKRWVVERDATYERYKVLVEGRSLDELLYDESFSRQIVEHASTIGCHYPTLLSHVNRYIHAGAHKRGAFSRTFLCGGRGKPKIFSSPSGRPNLAYERKESDIRGFVCKELDRVNCELGWQLYKRPNRSVDDAYVQFLNRFYAKTSFQIGPGQFKVELLPQGHYPTKEQFERFGRKNDEMRAPGLMNMSKKARRNNVDGHGGSARSQYSLAMQMGIIDSTSDDQGALCSVASPLLMLQSPWTTRVVCAVSDYIFGEYTSFERVGARTHMAAIVHAATEKSEWARSHGYHLEKGEWHHGEFKGICGDNGEGKCIEVIGSLEDAEMEAVFTQTYLSRARSLVEKAHLMSHLLVDWRTTGSTFGKMRNRTDKLDTDSPFDFTAHLHRRIAGVVHINNVERVEHLLTLEMRRQGVEPTRRGILEYMRETGQVADGPGNILALLPASLPRVPARVCKDGIRIWDPRRDIGTRYIPNLIFWSPWLAEAGVLTAAGLKPKDIMVAMDPMHLGRIYVDHEKRWKEVKLLTNDEEKRRTTLVDWIAITDHDATKRFFTGHTVLQSKASLAASTEAIEQAGAARKAQALANGETPPKGKTKRGVTKDELELQNKRRLGLDSLVPEAAEAVSAEPEPALVHGRSAGESEAAFQGLPTWVHQGVSIGGRA